MQGGDQYCARLAYNCAERVLTYLEIVRGENPLFLQAPQPGVRRDTEVIPPNEQLDYFRKKFLLPYERVKITVELIQVASFSGKYATECKKNLDELGTILKKGAT